MSKRALGWYRRKLRRRHVAFAYDMAKEIANYLGRGQQVIDIGCGNGFIAHHLSALLATPVIGVDIFDQPEAPIAYGQFDGERLSAYADDSFDAALLCYVLHHCQDIEALLAEVARVVRPGGQVVIYEDLPTTSFDRLLCWRHDRAWRSRSGNSSFFDAETWPKIFSQAGFTLKRARGLSRLRDINHPVDRRLYLLEVKRDHVSRIRSSITASPSRSSGEILTAR